MLSLLHPEDIDKDFVSGTKISICLSTQAAICVFHLKSCVIVYNGIHIFENRTLLSVRSHSLICSLPSYLHYVALYPIFWPNNLIYQYPSEGSMSLNECEYWSRMTDIFLLVANHLWTIHTVVKYISIEDKHTIISNCPQHE